MPDVTYTFVSRCAGGGHTTINVQLNGTNLGDYVYATDEIRASLASMSQPEREALALGIAKVHFAGKTRAQIVTEFQAGPVVVTI